MTDGRHARSERSREAIVEALLELLRTGDGVPTSEEVARRAGVTQRTLFNHFEDVPSLLASAVHRQVSRVEDELLPEPVSGRIGDYVAALSRSLDEIAAVRWAVLTHGGSPELQAGLRRVRAASRARLATLLDTDDDEVLAAAELVTDPIAWRLLRRQQGLSRVAAARVMTRALLALAPATAARGSSPSVPRTPRRTGSPTP